MAKTRPLKRGEERGGGEERSSTERLHALIREWVLHALGEPAGLRQVEVRPLWENHYRVNVLVGADASSTKVAHSYFLVADGEGDIVSSTPMITKQY